MAYNRNRGRGGASPPGRFSSGRGRAVSRTIVPISTSTGGSLSSRFGQIYQDNKGGSGGGQSSSSSGRFAARTATSAGIRNRSGIQKPRSNRSPRQNRAVAVSSRMDIDQGSFRNQIGRKPGTNRLSQQHGDSIIANRGNGRQGGRGGARDNSGGRGRGRGGGRGGRGGRGGSSRGGGATGRRGPPPSRESLDMDLDKYMLSDAKTRKSTLDNDLDAYMMGTSEIPLQGSI